MVISDAHANPAALKAVLESERWEEVVFLGDAVDYGPDPGDVVDLLRSLDPSVALMGNHDAAVAFGGRMRVQGGPLEAKRVRS